MKKFDHRNIILMMVFYSALPRAFKAKKYAMDEKCGKTITMDGKIFHSANVQQTFRNNYALNTRCRVLFETMEPYRFIIVFKRLDIEFEPLCDDDNLQIFDGNSTSHPTVQGLPSRICGQERPPGSYVSTSSQILMAFHSDFYDVRDGFEITLTTFREPPCEVEEEFRCRNGRCISALLQCDGTNNCGDYSDECQWTAGVLVGILGGVLFLTIAGIVTVRFGRKKRLLKMPRKLKKDKTREMTLEIFSTPEEDVKCEHLTTTTSKRSLAPVPGVHQPQCHLYKISEETRDKTHIQL